MVSDSSELSRRKHHRSSSSDDAEERSKRRKHRHHRHRHHHRRHRSKKDKEEATIIADEEIEDEKVDEIENQKLKPEKNRDRDGGAIGEVLVSNGSKFAGVEYDMEEGEILEDHGLIDYRDETSGKLKRTSDSDVESGEIAANGYDSSIMGVTEENMGRRDQKLREPEKCFKDGKISADMHTGGASLADVLVNGEFGKKDLTDGEGVLLGDVKKARGSDDEVEYRRGMKCSSSEKRLRAVSRSLSRDKYVKEDSHSNISNSPEKSGRRSRSRSILREASTADAAHKLEDPLNIDRKRRNDSEDESLVVRSRSYRHGSREERQRSSSRYYGREAHDRYREGSRERDHNLDGARARGRDREEWDREREKARRQDLDRREKERVRVRERHPEKDRERDRGRERDREKSRERERGREREVERERLRERERDRVRKERNDREGTRRRDMDRDNEGDRFSRRQSDYTYRDRVGDSRNRTSEDHYREILRASDFGNASSQDNLEPTEKPKGEDDGLEDYQDMVNMQIAAQEEDDIEKIKEESRRRRQAILEKYKNLQQQGERQSEDEVEEQVGQSSKKVASPIANDNKVDSANHIAEPSFSVEKSPSENGILAIEKPTETGGLGEGTPKSVRAEDMFCDDIFGESPAGARRTGTGDIAIEKGGVHDNWDDAEGYYGYRFGEILDGRYEIIAAHGRGVFSNVVRAMDLKAKAGDPEEVAIKIIRNNETMYKAGMEELVILKKLVGADPENKRHCVRFISTFKYRNHLCLVFESLHMNLREVLKKFGRNIGLKLTAVRTYAKQLFIALKHLKNCGVLHCDIKPDNMLVNEAKNVLKLCDFGNAMFAGKNEITPYLVSRFYRAPEIILGLPYDHPLDIWSVGCCLFELYTGKVLFPGVTNNDMLRLHMELKGPFPKKMLRKGAFADQHFDNDLNFLATEEDPVTKKAIRRLIVNMKPKDFGTLISRSSGDADSKMIANFKDLLEKIFVLDPDKRLNVSQALSHPFITGK